MISLGKNKIDIKSFTKRKVKKIDDHFGVYFICGKQGSGKTYEAVRLAKSLKGNGKIITNIKSLKFADKYFTTLNQIENNVETNTLFIIDEVSKKYTRNSQCDRAFYSWLNQSRKRRRIVILITQEWRELPMWLRRPAKLMLNVKKCIHTPITGIYKTCVGDAENMEYDKDENEYVCPPLYYIYHKRNREIANLYDTFEPINEL